MMAKRDGAIVLEKCPTGIRGFDEISNGGLPRGRPSLICGSAGCGKTVLCMEFLLRGASQYKEPGVFVSFEESTKDLAQNFASIGYDLNDMIARKLIAMDHIQIDKNEIEETGEYDLEGLFIRLADAIDSIKAKRIVLDTIEALFSGLSNLGILRAEIRRLFRWLKDRGITAVITGESGEKTLTRYGLEEYVADCVILLDFRATEQISTRRLRIIKYRGSGHGSDEYPFLIGENGISILPVTSLGLNHSVTNERVSSGIPRLDNMLAGKGFYRGSTILISGTAGTGKSSFAAKFVEAACKRGERCLYLAFEESADQIIRNMKSIGTDLAPWVKKDRLKFHASRPSLYGLEMHLVTIHNLIIEFMPQIVIVDPISNLTTVGSSMDVKSVLTRLFDYLKMTHVTTLLTDLVHFENSLERTNDQISSLVDTWVLLRHVEINGERNRGLYILKSRGMDHSNQIREVLLSNSGIKLLDVYLGPGGVLTGSARAAQKAKEKAEANEYERDMARRIRAHEAKRKALEVKIKTLRADFDMEFEELMIVTAGEKNKRNNVASDQNQMSRLRKTDQATGPRKNKKKKEVG